MKENCRFDPNKKKKKKIENIRPCVISEINKINVLSHT